MVDHEYRRLAILTAGAIRSANIGDWEYVATLARELLRIAIEARESAIRPKRRTLKLATAGASAEGDQQDADGPGRAHKKHR